MRAALRFSSGSIGNWQAVLLTYQGTLHRRQASLLQCGKKESIM
ncbi:hypothetical protein [Adhaeretor mobilis]|nr:hypothetical protein [Adhaeretor mobilis]